MKLLIITQVIDTEHPILGFFHRWVEEFAKHCEHVHVICLQAGKHSLPANVTIHSLGKEDGATRFQYLRRFYSLIWSLRHEYDTVFVHMNQIYVILGGVLWRVLGKHIGLWYAHGTVTRSLRVATVLSHTVFTSTPEGFRITTPKRIIVGQGIDTAQFSPTVDKIHSETLRLVTVGRIASSKNLDTLLRACALLKEQGVTFHFTIIGVATTPAEETYAKEISTLTETLKLTEYVSFLGAVTQSELPRILRMADIFIHDGTTNSLDKTLLEAALCGCIVISSNPAYRSLTAELAPALIFRPNNHQELANIITEATNHTEAMARVQAFLKENFSIQNLISGIVGRY